MALLKIRSISDTVTNSSTEVFLVKTSTEIKKHLKLIEESLNEEFKYIETIDDCREYFRHAHKCDDLDHLNICIKNGYFLKASGDRIGSKDLCSQARYSTFLEDEVTEDEIWEKYKDVYSCLKNTAIGYIEDHASAEHPEFAIIYGLTEVLIGGACRLS